MKNRSVPVDTVLPHVNYQNLGEAMAWLTKTFGFREYYRYGDGPSGGQMWAGKAAIQVRQADSGQKSPAQLGYGTQSLTLFVDDVDEHYERANAAGRRLWRSRIRRSTGNISMRLKIWTDITGCSRGTRTTAAQKTGAR
jgi:hypothetical protein